MGGVLFDKPIFTGGKDGRITARGEVLGLISFCARAHERRNFFLPGNMFVPINLLKPILKDLINY